MSNRRFALQCRRWLAILAVAAIPLPAVGSVARSQRSGAPPARTGAIVGVVRDAEGHPVAHADVTAAGLGTATDSMGTFALGGLPVGLVTLTVRRLGFRAIVAQWQVTGEPLTLNLTLSPVPLALPAVLVRSRAEPYDSRLAGFNERRERNVGYFITREQIDRQNTFQLTDALRRIPGVKVVAIPGGLGRTVTLPGARCPPLVMVDGFPASLGRFDLDMIDLTTVEGIEVYPHGSSVPAELMGPYGMESCGVIGIWSRPMRPNVRADQLPPEHVDLDSLMASNTVYLPDAVDQQAQYIDGSARPLYPDSLYRAATPGRAVARFVVDTAGNVELGTVDILSATRREFEDAVRDALKNARFHPAVLHGRPVRAMVELPFDFNRSDSDTSRTGG